MTQMRSAGKCRLHDVICWRMMNDAYVFIVVISRTPFDHISAVTIASVTQDGLLRSSCTHLRTNFVILGQIVQIRSAWKCRLHDVCTRMMDWWCVCFYCKVHHSLPLSLDDMILIAHCGRRKFYTSKQLLLILIIADKITNDTKIRSGTKCPLHGVVCSGMMDYESVFIAVICPWLLVDIVQLVMVKWARFCFALYLLIFLYCCLDCPHCLALLNSIGWAT